MNIMTTENIRNAFIRIIIERWINTTSKLKILQVPKQIKEDSNEYIQDCNEVLGFIMDGYIITNNEEDRIQSSVLFNDFKTKTSAKMLPSKFKDDMLGISGITFKATNKCKYFCGLKENIEGVNE